MPRNNGAKVASKPLAMIITRLAARIAHGLSANPLVAALGARLQGSAGETKAGG